MKHYLRSIDPEQNRYRWYSIQFQLCFDGGIDLIRSWGRIGKGEGREKIEHFDTEEEAEKAAHFSETFELPKKTVKEILEELFELATKETVKKGSFSLPGIGKLTKVKRKARKGRNPATGESIRIPAKTVVKMRLSKTCKDAIVPPKK